MRAQPCNASGSVTQIASGTNSLSLAADFTTIRRSALGATGTEMSSGMSTTPPRSTVGSGFSTSTDGRMRSSQCGSHQFHWWNIAISAGTSTSRTTVASTAMATAQATPSSATSGIPAKANPMNTAIMISAALVMVRALVLTP
ncbi:hypothetical protein C1Y40_05217 [Mycobacterium talmoniae]|uniref:Uncharacterized protein n=1 Tax=Mycobacterium talmoniae TaxID=1858794 RepID=A0A2S8BDB5_9MYCO|nr:hypothetical protein C1Y40_05217 [Mycobacterium talmoniae]